jgi:putative transposase
MVTPNRRRQAVIVLEDVFGVSQRRACRVVGQHRSTQRLEPPVRSDEEEQIRRWLRDFSMRRPRWGWRRAAKGLRRAGWYINNKRVQRLWRDEGLQVPTRKRKQRLCGIGTHLGAMSPIAPNALWALDFQFDHTIDGHQVKLLNVIDEFTREALAVVVDRSIDADHVVVTLDRLTIERGRAPAFVRFDHGPEFIAHAVADWCSDNGTKTVFIDPGSPWQNAWIESFNGRVRDEMLNLWQFDSLLEAQVLIEDWRIDYNHHRPHSAHGDLTPTEFTEAWTMRNQPQPA